MWYEYSITLVPTPPFPFPHLWTGTRSFSCAFAGGEREKERGELDSWLIRQSSASNRATRCKTWSLAKSTSGVPSVSWSSVNVDKGSLSQHPPPLAQNALPIMNQPSKRH